MYWDQDLATEEIEAIGLRAGNPREVRSAFVLEKTSDSTRWMKSSVQTGKLVDALDVCTGRYGESTTASIKRNCQKVRRKFSMAITLFV